MKLLLLFLCSTITLTWGVAVKQSRKFPNDFVFGTSTAAYQIEGAWDKDGKSENIWDYLTHTNPGAIADQSTGDVACDSYHKYERDVEMLRELGIDAYRFSLAWSRILPNGLANHVNEEGIAYYNKVIDEVLKYNIEPMVTLYHWDLPQKLQDMGGFLNPLVIDWFADYARVVYERFGDRVKNFITFNEGGQICYEGYGSDSKAPRLNFTGTGEYICAKNLALAHAKAYHIYNDEFRPTQGGVLGYTIAMSSTVPLTDSEEDAYAVELFRQSEWAVYTDPIFSKDGGFPKDLLELVAKKSAAQGFPRSRLSDFTEEEKAYIRGTSDFFGVNHYTGALTSASLFTSQFPVPSTMDDIEVAQMKPDDWPQAASSWLQSSIYNEKTGQVRVGPRTIKGSVVGMNLTQGQTLRLVEKHVLPYIPTENQMPNSVYITMKSIQERYGDVPIYITENGWSTYEGIEDEGRVAYYRAALESALDAMDEGINLKGYFAWSLMDNFEWMAGYTERFGLYEVNYDDPERTRTPRKSAFIYKQIIKTRTIDHEYEPDSNVMTIDEGH